MAVVDPLRIDAAIKYNISLNYITAKTLAIFLAEAPNY